MGSDNAIPAKTTQRIEDLPSEDISSFSRGSEGFVFPNRRILDETIRNLMFHDDVVWYGWFIAFGFIYAIKYIRK